MARTYWPLIMFQMDEQRHNIGEDGVRGGVQNIDVLLVFRQFCRFAQCRYAIY